MYWEVKHERDTTTTDFIPRSIAPEHVNVDPSPRHRCVAARWAHLVSSVFPSRTSWISLASRVSYKSRASASFLCSLA